MDAGSFGGQLRKNKEFPSFQWRNQFWQSLKEGAEKRDLECDRPMCCPVVSACLLAAIFDEVNRLFDDTMLNSITSPCALLYDIVMLTAVRWNLVHLCSI